MEDHVEKFRQADALAQNILRLTRNTLLVNLRFLDLALSQFQLTSYPGTLATDGQHQIGRASCRERVSSPV